MIEAASSVGMGEAEIYDSSVRYVVARLKGANELETRESQRTWEAARFMAFYALIAPGNVKKGALRSPRDLVEFTWDKERVSEWVEVPQLSAAENRALDVWIKKNYPEAMPVDWQPPKSKKPRKTKTKGQSHPPN